MYIKSLCVSHKAADIAAHESWDLYCGRCIYANPNPTNMYDALLPCVESTAASAQLLVCLGVDGDNGAITAQDMFGWYGTLTHATVVADW